MRQALTLYRSSVGKKVLMAVSGILLAGFVSGHMLGNLKMFQGPEAMDGYAVFLRSSGTPSSRSTAFSGSPGSPSWRRCRPHRLAAFQLWRQSRAARGQPTGRRIPRSSPTPPAPCAGAG
jgi:succinate dehydrogenase / fumarate reductase, cytochrome b subunit